MNKTPLALDNFVDFSIDPFLCDAGVAAYVEPQELADFLRAIADLRIGMAEHSQPKVDSTARISSLANITNDVAIGPGCTVGEFSTIRDGTVLGSNVEIGFGCEVARSIIGAGTRLSHRATVTDAIIGINAYFGAGVVAASTHLFEGDMKMPRRDIKIRLPGGGQYSCGTAKFAGLFGDSVRIGMGSLLGPGIIVGRASILYPGVVLSSQMVAEGKVVKVKYNRILIERRRGDVK